MITYILLYVFMTASQGGINSGTISGFSTLNECERARDQIFSISPKFFADAVCIKQKQ